MKRWILTLALCAAASAQVKLPPYTRDVLPNGTVVYLAPKGNLPLVNFRVLIKGGTESEPAGLAGIANLTSGMLRRGTSQWSADQFADELDGLGGTFFADPDRQAIAISAEFLKKDFDKGLSLVADAVLHPTFPEAEVRKSLSRAADQVKSMKDIPGASIDNFYETFFFGTAHPYGRNADEASIDRIRRDDILAYHKRMFTGKNLVVIVAGDFDAAMAKKRVAETFGAAPAGEAYRWVDDKPPVAASKVLLVDKPDATQTYFVIAQPGVRRDASDRSALLLVNNLFGGRFTSMINDELRVNSGLTYGARCNIDFDRLSGGLQINTYTKTETTEKAIDLALDVLKRLREKGLNVEQLASAKAYVKGTYAPQTVQTADQIATVLGQFEIFGLDRNEVDEFYSRIDAVTLAQANAAIQKYYKTDNLTFVLLGQAEKIRDVARKYGPVTERAARASGWN
jgi:predicted Zn-dependent peptidase